MALSEQVCGELLSSSPSRAAAPVHTRSTRSRTTRTREVAARHAPGGAASGPADLLRRGVRGSRQEICCCCCWRPASQAALAAALGDRAATIPHAPGQGRAACADRGCRCGGAAWRVRARRWARRRGCGALGWMKGMARRSGGGRTYQGAAGLPQCLLSLTELLRLPCPSWCAARALPSLPSCLHSCLHSLHRLPGAWHTVCLPLANTHATHAARARPATSIAGHACTFHVLKSGKASQEA